MKYGSLQHRYLLRLLAINPKLTVGQAAYCLKMLVTYKEAHYEQD
jgi:hypothetical protein